MAFRACTRQQLDTLLKQRQGSLAETPYAVLLLALALRESPSTLRLRHNQLEKEVFFEDRSPVECRSNIATEILGRYLVSTGRLSKETEVKAFSESAARRVPLGEVLVEWNLITPTELYRSLQQNLGRKLLEPFSWKNGTYQISFDAPATASPLRVRVPQLIVTGIMKVEHQETADAAAAAVKGKYVTLATEPLVRADDIRLTPQQQQVIETARAGATLDEIRASSGLEDDDLNRIVYALLLLGVLAVTDERVPWTPPFDVEVVAVPALEPVSFTPPSPSASSEEVIAEYLSFRRKDAFELLGVADTDGLLLVKQAFIRMAEKFLPTQFEEQAPDALREKAQEVFLAAARAYAELADPQRHDALVRLRAKRREEKPAAANEPKRALIDPDAFWKSGSELLVKRKFREALSYFEMAADCDAQNGTYAAEVAWCRYQLGLTPPTNALAGLKNAIRIDPKAGVAYLYAGQVQAAMGKNVEAEGYIQRAESLLPKDPRIAEARRVIQRR
jgi:tetratricopeptide (TPR) repeat protein